MNAFNQPQCCSPTSVLPWISLHDDCVLVKFLVENITRDHVIDISKSGLVTITGGKWTTYRLMAEDVVNKILTGKLCLLLEAIA